MILIYPWHRGMGEHGVAHRWREPGTRLSLDIATIDVGHPGKVAKTLCSIIGLEHPDTNRGHAPTGESFHSLDAVS